MLWALGFISTCTFCCVYSHYLKAAEAAYADKDLKSLEEILHKEGPRNPELAHQVQMMIGKLGSY